MANALKDAHGALAGAIRELKASDQFDRKLVATLAHVLKVLEQNTREIESLRSRAEVTDPGDGRTFAPSRPVMSSVQS